MKLGQSPLLSKPREINATKESWLKPLEATNKFASKSFQNTFIFQKGNVNKAELCTYHFKNVLFNRCELGGGKRFIILMPAVGGA